MSVASILIVEDEAIIEMDIENKLNKLGYKVIGSASKGEEAVELAEKLQPDLILMDIVLKGNIDGIEASDTIHDRLDIPVVFLTAYSDEKTLQRAKISGPYGYILKPLQERELNIVIDIALNQHEMKKRLKAANISLEQRVQEELYKNLEKDAMLLKQGQQNALYELMFNISHHWRQPLTGVAVIIQNLQETIKKCNQTDPETKKYALTKTKKALEIILGMSQTIDNFKNIFQPNDNKIFFSVQEVLEKTIRIFNPILKNENITVKIGIKNDSVINNYQNGFVQVISNILNNAKEVIIERNVKSPKIMIELFREHDKAVLTIADNGGGIPEAVIGKVFNPYFSTKEMGIGLGLYMARMITEKNMNGMISVSNIKRKNFGSGAEFRIEL